jgi:hypothetical protein
VAQRGHVSERRPSGSSALQQKVKASD